MKGVGAMLPIEELRNWAALKMGWTEYLTPSMGNHPMAKAWNIVGSGRLMAQDEWQPDNPTTGQIWMLVERMRELGFPLVLHNKGNGWIANFPNQCKKNLTYKRHIDPCLAILKAARATKDYQ